MFTDLVELSKQYTGAVRVLVPRAPEDPMGSTLTLCLNGEVILLRVGDMVSVPECVAQLMVDAGL